MENLVTHYYGASCIFKKFLVLCIYWVLNAQYLYLSTYYLERVGTSFGKYHRDKRTCTFLEKQWASRSRDRAHLPPLYLYTLCDAQLSPISPTQRQGPSWLCKTFRTWEMAPLGGRQMAPTIRCRAPCQAASRARGLKEAYFSFFVNFDILFHKNLWIRKWRYLVCRSW